MAHSGAWWYLKFRSMSQAAVGIAREELRRRGIRLLTAEEYWRQFREEWLAAVFLCYQCWSDTTDEEPGNTLYPIGNRLRGAEDECDVCGSVVQRLWFCFIIPIMPLDRYRVIWTLPNQYVGRLLRKTDVRPE